VFSNYSPGVIEILQGCDLMLHVSKKESQGRILLEAMSAGLPAVAYNVGGVGEAILNGETGILLPFGDVKGLVQAVCRLIGNQDERQQMGNAGHQRVNDNFSAEKTAQSVRENIYQVLIRDMVSRSIDR
jgi:glycosyltransferase involved in cell wall biosynthesis